MVANFVRVHAGRLAQFSVPGVGKVYVVVSAFPDKTVPQSLDVSALGLREPSDVPAGDGDAAKAAEKAEKAKAKAEAVQAKATARAEKATAAAQKAAAAAEAALARAAKAKAAAEATSGEQPSGEQGDQPNM